MESKIEINTYFGQCTCCLRYAYLKSMWSKYEWNGEIETYAEMLLDCFGLNNSWYTTNEDRDRICENCISRLRDACQFKTQVLKIQEDFRNGTDELNKEIKMELNSEASDDENFECIEYLDEELLEIDNEKEATTQSRKRRPRYTASDECKDDDDISEKPTKWPKKLPVNQRYQTYKQYTADDFRDCIEAIKRNEMSPKEASVYFKIPFKTITAKIRRGILEEDNPIPLTKTRELIEDVKLILTYTNATPFKSRFNQIMCAFCSVDCTGDELKNHTVDCHPNRITKVEAMLRPYYDNQMLKIDIQDLKCTTCDLPALYWSDMLEHLSTKHNLNLIQAKTNIIPYLVTEHISCAICNENFSAFMLVDSHMNTHYTNFSCADCGDTFITLPRLKNHEKIHDIGKYPCHLCDKVFHLKDSRKRHILTQHNKSNLVYKCRHCAESFSSESLRQKHMISSHVETINIINCEFCGAMFYFKRIYQKHLRRKHNTVNVCKVCGKSFESEFLLNEHKLRHSSIKEFHCDICKKGYYSQTSLKWHLKRNHNEDIKSFNDEMESS